MSVPRMILWLFGSVVALWLTLPVLVVIPVSLGDKPSFVFPADDWSLRWYRNLVEDPAWSSAIWSSLKVAVVSATLATVLGTLAAIGLWRLRSRRITAMIQGSLLLPLIVPEIVLAIGLYAIFLRAGLIGTVPGFVVAHAAMGLPYVVVAVMVSLNALDQALLDAAGSLGASPLQAWRGVGLPLISSGVVTGFLFAFVASFDNVVFSLFLKSPSLTTLPVQMFSSLTRDTDPTIAAAATVVMTITVTLIVVGLSLLRRMRRLNDIKEVH